jgi:hypothetical protein
VHRSGTTARWRCQLQKHHQQHKQQQQRQCKWHKLALQQVVWQERMLLLLLCTFKA